jgi:hypothetical protein
MWKVSIFNGYTGRDISFTTFQEAYTCFHKLDKGRFVEPLSDIVAPKDLPYSITDPHNREYFIRHDNYKLYDEYERQIVSRLSAIHTPNQIIWFSLAFPFDNRTTKRNAIIIALTASEFEYKMSLINNAVVKTKKLD